MAIKRNLATTGFVVLCALAGVALLASRLFGTDPVETKSKQEAAAVAKDLGTSGGIDPKAASNKLAAEISRAQAEKTAKEAVLLENNERNNREQAARALAAARARGERGLPSYPASTPNGGSSGNSALTGSAVQNMTADEQAQLAREIEAAAQLAALRKATMVAFEDSGVATQGSTTGGGVNAAINRAARSAGLPSVEELVRMGNVAGNATTTNDGGGNNGNSGLDAMRSALQARALAGSNPTPSEPTVGQRNANFMKEAAAGAAKGERDKATAASFPRAPLSKFMLTEGWTIPAVLSRGINSDLAGDFSAIVTQKIYDSVSGSVCLVPQGATLTGKYNSEVAAGQQRLLFAVTGLRYPNGTYVPLGSMNASDASGASGLAGDVNNHFWKIFGSSMAIAAVSTTASVIGSRSNAGNVAINVGNSMTGNSANVLSDVTKKMLDRNTSIKPTIRLGVGEKFTVAIAHDLVLPLYLTNPNCN